MTIPSLLSHSPAFSRLKSVLAEQRRPTLGALGIFFLVYSFFIFNFLFGNHDWESIFTRIPWSALAWVGRPFCMLPLQVWQGFYIPVLTPVVSLGAYFCAGVLFLALFSSGKSSPRVFFLALLLFLLNPVLLGRIYYEGAAIGENIALCGFFLAINFLVYDKDRKSFLLAVLLFGFALGVNQCIINTFWTVLLILALYELLIPSDFNIFRYCCAFAVALAIYLIVIKFLYPVRPFYNTQLASPDVFLKNFLPQLKASVAYFWETQPPMNRLFKMLFSLICLGAFARLLACPKKTFGLRHGRFSAFFGPKTGFALRLLLIAALVLTNNAVAYVSGYAIANTFNLRIDYYSIPCILGFCAVVALGLPGFWGRVFTAAAALLVILSMGSDVRALQVWKISIDDDLLYANRMLARIEASPEFDAGKAWRVLALGERPVFGNRFWPGYDRFSLELQRSMHLGRNFPDVFNYIAPNLKLSPYTGEPGEVCAKNRPFLDAAPAWPSPDSLRVLREEGLILVVLDRAAARRYCAR